MKKLILPLALISITAQAQLFNIAPQEESNNDSGISFGAPAESSPPPTADGGSLSAYFESSRDLQSDFVQTVHNQRGTESSRGKMWISKPGKFYWDYQSPNAQKIISNGSKVWQYDLDLEQISIRHRDELVGDVAMEILGGSRKLDELFTITQVQRSQAPVALQSALGNGEIYRLTPNTTQDGYDAVWVGMQNGSVKAISVDGGRGQQTVIEFQNLKRNTGIPASQFEFSPPAGVDVIGE